MTVQELMSLLSKVNDSSIEVVILDGNNTYEIEKVEEVNKDKGQPDHTVELEIITSLI